MNRKNLRLTTLLYSIVILIFANFSSTVMAGAEETAEETLITLNITNAPVSHFLTQVSTLSNIPINYLRQGHQEPTISLNLNSAPASTVLAIAASLANLTVDYEEDCINVSQN